MREVLPLLRNSATIKSKIVADWYLTCYITVDALGISEVRSVLKRVERSPVCWKLEYLYSCSPNYFPEFGSKSPDSS